MPVHALALSLLLMSSRFHKVECYAIKMTFFKLYHLLKVPRSLDTEIAAKIAKVA